MLLAVEGEGEQFWNRLEHSIINRRSALRRNYFTRGLTWCFIRAWSAWSKGNIQLHPPPTVLYHLRGWGTWEQAEVHSPGTQAHWKTVQCSLSPQLITTSLEASLLQLLLPSTSCPPQPNYKAHWKAKDTIWRDCTSVRTRMRHDRNVTTNCCGLNVSPKSSYVGNLIRCPHEWIHMAIVVVG